MDTIFNTQNGKAIKTGNIVKLDSTGVLVNENKYWQHIPAKDIEIKRLYEEEYFKKEKLPELNLTPSISQYNEAGDSAATDYTEKAKCFFGIKNLEFCRMKYFQTSAICSTPINVDNCEYLTLAVSEDNSENSRAEYYIVDGSSEQAVLPEGVDAVNKERLFFGLPTRFKIDKSKPIVLYRDNLVVGDNYYDLTNDDFEEHEYLLDYTPSGESHKYKPENKQIQIKIIIRCFGDNFTPLRVKNVLLNKYGDRLAWNLKSQVDIEANT